MSTELCYLSALEATRLFRSRALSPVELMRALIARAEEIESEVNAFSDTFFGQAMRQAGEAEKRYARGESAGMLDGIAVAIKDEVDVQGQRNTEGSLIHRQRMATEDAILVARLRAAGAIFQARTTCPEFCSLWSTQSRLFGVTRNPWNLEVSPGGSSGGSGAALAGGTTTLATGSDIGGSIRFPAALCGLVGFKPPFGRVPETYRPFNLESYCANGPMARTVADTALMQNVMSGAHPLDAASSLPDIEIPLEFEGGLRGRKIAFSMDFGYLDVEPDVVRNTNDALERLKALGAEVAEVDLDWPEGIEQAYNAHMEPLFYAAMAGLLETDRERLCDYNVEMAEEALERRRRNPLGFYQALCIEAEMYGKFAAVMEAYDAFVCPTVNATTLKADFNPVEDEYIINGKVQAYDLNLSSCHFFNMMGRCPSMSVPSGLGDNGVPTGLQIASTAYDDIAVFRVAAALESTWSKPFRPPL
jgi:Asp-tRNA(Asn)/Glu-tRNA(Gln) amidotransferase A subunit family amidase